jgi:methylphosphotriester-DNA--protein-cysteine methyltransferase
MERGLLKELQSLLSLVEDFKRDLSEISSKKEGLKAVNKHIDESISESEEAVKKLIDMISKALDELNELKLVVEKLGDRDREIAEEKINNLISILTNSLTLLEFQDILAQRLLKIKKFLSDLEKSILKMIITAGLEDEKHLSKEKIQEKLEELEWKKEVSQEEIDEIMKEFGP